MHNTTVGRKCVNTPGPIDSPIRAVADMAQRTHARDGRELDARNKLSERHIRAFWSKVDRSGGADACWPWTASCAVNGYGVYGIGWKEEGRWLREQWKSHRLAWSLATGLTIPAAAVIRHTCDNPPCCNPRHLLIGSQADNVADKVARERQSQGPRHRAIMRRVAPRGEQNGHSRLTDDAVRELRALHSAGVSYQALAAHFDVSRPTAYRAATGRTWRHVS